MEARTVPEKAVISHRGEKYEIGRGKRFYGIWVIGAPYDAPVDRWPENPDGWQQAWTRFAALEAPGAIAPVTRERKGLRPGFTRPGSEAGASGVPGADGAAEEAAAEGGAAEGGGTVTALRSRRGGLLLGGEALLVLGVVLGIAGIFPAYSGGQSLVSQSDQVVPHLCYVIGWAVTAALVALSVARPGKAARLGALFGLGLSAVTFGMFLADWGQVTVSGVSIGTGLVVSTAGWLACTAGAGLVLGARTGSAAPGAPAEGTMVPGTFRPRPGRLGAGQAGPVTLLVLAAVGTAAAFAPSWDSYVLSVAATGASQASTAGNAFDNPGLAIAGNVCVMVAIVAVAALAALWRPARQGALLLAGAIVPLAAQAASALIQVSHPASPSMFGVSPAQASAVGLTISSGLTGIFWVYFVFVISLVVSCAWLFTEPGRPVMPGIAAPTWQPTDGGAGTTADSAAAVREEADTDSDSTESGTDAESETPATDSEAGTTDDGQSAYA
jgi:hypothetical protein